MTMKVFGTHTVGLLSVALISAGGVAACSEEQPYNGYFQVEPPPVQVAEPAEPKSPKTPATPEDTNEEKPKPAVTCDTARDQLLSPVDKVSTGTVKTVTRTADPDAGPDVPDAQAPTNRAPETFLIVDGTAGGFEQAGRNPRIYVDLAKLERVDVTDVTARASAEWDLAFKRATIFTNSGHAGIGKGGTTFLAQKRFEDVTLASLTGKTFDTETFVDAQCTPQADAIGAPMTTFEGWYEYEGASMRVTPRKGVHVIKRDARYFKVEIVSYYGDASLGTSLSSANYVLRVAEITQ